MNWSSENHKDGFRKCTPIGYFLSGIAYLFFLITLVFPFAIGGIIANQLRLGNYSHSLLNLFLFPIITFVIYWTLDTVASAIAERKGFKYDYEKDECTWNQP